MHVLCLLLFQTVQFEDSNAIEPIRARDAWQFVSFKIAENMPMTPEGIEFSGQDSNEPNFGSMLWQDTVDVLKTPLRWNQGDLLEMGSLVAGIALVNQFDDQIMDFSQSNNNPALNFTSKEIGRFGEEYSFATLAAFYLSGKLFKDEKAVMVAKDGLIASIIAAGVVTPLIKEAGGRVRPRDQTGEGDFQPFSGNHSFPSGHTTQAFAIASVISEHYTNPWARGASYGLASLVGLSRIQDDAHYASDVVAGAAIGFLIGRKVVRLNLGKRDRITIDASVSDGYLGVRIRVPQERRGIRELLGFD